MSRNVRFHFTPWSMKTGEGHVLDRIGARRNGDRNIMEEEDTEETEIQSPVRY